MEKNFIEKIKQKLEKEKESAEKQLEKFANKDKKLKDDWDTKYPYFNRKESGNASLEQAADEVEEYGNLLPIEHSLEIRLKNTNSALKKIKTNEYGFCEKCHKKISEERLEIYPSAQFCLKCKSS